MHFMLTLDNRKDYLVSGADLWQTGGIYTTYTWQVAGSTHRIRSPTTEQIPSFDPATSAVTLLNKRIHV
jgi:hypothetical protein